MGSDWPFSLPTLAKFALEDGWSLCFLLLRLRYHHLLSTSVSGVSLLTYVLFYTQYHYYRHWVYTAQFIDISFLHETEPIYSSRHLVAILNITFSLDYGYVSDIKLAQRR